ncbi:dynamitin-domain-containing protein [Phanerochaete sordida]|uniref:Dynamitin-domain-containing protein n=1 Tax=Phanerochaete sordida TaxID=48140 RepID=A0A9P3GK86_9APHY|nr:dynamitin-domain-containing protein [Phanerochaete sordida]
MNATKYASLPDIDTAPDVYETEDVFPTHETKQESSDEESGVPSRHSRGKDLHAKPEELDSSSLMDPSEAGKKFRKAEKRRHRPRIQYTYPPSPTSSSGRSSPEVHHTLPPQHHQLHHHHQRSPASTLTQRLTSLKAELAALEAELGEAQKEESESVVDDDDDEPVDIAAEVEDTPKPDGGKPRKSERAHVEAGELIKEVVDVKARLEKIGKLKDGRNGREKLVSAVLQGVGERATSREAVTEQDEEPPKDEEKKEEGVPLKLEVRDIAEMDRRLGELERAVGASSATVDETTPLPPPLLPLLTRLNTQLTLLSQPRHIDNISRRLKLLLSDLDRLSAANQHGAQGGMGGSQRRGTGSHLGHGHALTGSLSGIHPGSPVTSQGPPVPSPHPHTDALAPILNRLSPLLPHIPHILTRLRTLSTLHTNAAAFQSTLEALEEEQKRVRRALEELEGAVQSVEGSLKENEGVVKGNVVEVERRVDDVVRKVEAMNVASQQ